MRVLAVVISVVLSVPVSFAIATTCYDTCTPVELNAESSPVVYFACPQGDTGGFFEQGFTITMQLKWAFGGPPAVGVPASDIVLVTCEVDTIGCLSANPDDESDADGMIIFSSTKLYAGGCIDGVAIQHTYRPDPPFLPATCAQCECEDDICVRLLCLPVIIRSPDIDGNSAVDLVDLAIFSGSFPPQPYEACCDMDGNGVVNLVDLSMFARHFGPPGHACS